jgi:hypothetical protein
MQRAIGLILLILFWSIVSSASGPFRIETPIKGRVIDAETKKPIPKAVLRVDRIADCPRGGIPGGHGTELHFLPALEAETGLDGNFEIAGTATASPCGVFANWSDWLEVVAIGYWPAYGQDDPSYNSVWRSARSATWELNPIRYQLDFDSYRGIRDFHHEVDKKKLVTLENTIAAAKAAKVRPLGEPGVFATQAGAVFSKISVVQAGVYSDMRQDFVTVAQSRVPSSFYAWTSKGDKLPFAVPVPPGHDLVGDRREYPILLHKDGFYYGKYTRAKLTDLSQYWLPVSAEFGGIKNTVEYGLFLISLEANGSEIAVYEFQNGATPRSVTSRFKLSLLEVLPGATGPIECMTSFGDPYRSLAFIAGVSGEPSLFIASFNDPSMWWANAPRRLKAERFETVPGLLSDEVVACAGGSDDGLYVAQKHGGIVKIMVQKVVVNSKLIGRAKAGAALKGHSGSLTYVSLAVGKVEWAPMTSSEALYAVANDENIYRFNTDLLPDRRIEVQK